MSTIYLPTEYLDKPCYVVNNGYIRVYMNNSLTEYKDIYFDHDYMVKDGQSNYGYTGLCDTTNTYTDEVFYRIDFDKIMIITFVMFLFIIYFPTKLFFKFFRRFA